MKFDRWGKDAGSRRAKRRFGTARVGARFVEVTMTEYACKNGETWDSIAFDTFSDGFAMDSLLAANDYAHYDTVTFSDGDVIQIPQQAIMESAIIPNPWDASTVIDNPWGQI